MLSLFAVFTGLLFGLSVYAEKECTSEYKALLQFTRENRDVDGNDRHLKALQDKKEACEKDRLKMVADCNSVKADFNKSIADTQKACEKFDLKSSEDPGSIACSSKMDQCACLDKTTRAIEKTGGICAGVTEQTHPFCPQRTDANADRLQKKIENAEKQIKETKEKIDRLESESDKNENNQADKARESKTALRKAEADHAQAINEAQSQLSQAQAALYQQMNGLQEKIYTAEQSVTDTRLKDSGAYKEYLDQDLKIEMGCTTQATQAVSAMQGEAITAMRSGTYNRGDQNDLFRQVGMTDRAAWQKQAAIRKKWCMDSELTHASKKSNELTFEETKKGNAAAREIAQKQVAQLRQQMTQMMSVDGVSCNTTAANGAVIQTQACRDQAEMKRKTATADAALKAARADARDQEIAAAKAATKNQPKQDRKIGEAKADLADQEANLRNYKDKEKALDSTFPNAGAQAPDAKLLDTDFLKLTDRAGRMNRCCQLGTNDERYKGSPECYKSEKFLQAHKFSTDLTPASTTSNTPAQTQTPADQQPAGANREGDTVTPGSGQPPASPRRR